MKILPLTLHAAARIPALTNLFSETLAATSLAVVQSGQASLTTTAPHGVTVGQSIALSIVDCDVPNAITAATAATGGNWTLTAQFPHDLTVDSANVNWMPVVTLAGFGESAMNGVLQLVAVPSTTTLVVKPPTTVTSVTINGSQNLIERLEDGIIGWHKMTASDASTLQFTTPPHVARSYTVSNPSVTKNVRVAAALNLDVAKQQYVRGYKPGVIDQDSTAVAQAWMFITPPPSVAISKDRNAQGDAVAEITPYSDYRQLITDGFHIYVFLPAEHSAGGASCSDLASGDILQVVLKTFHGLVPPRTELVQADTYVSLMVEHGSAIGDYNFATYVHGYIFQAPGYLTQFDAIQPFEWSDIKTTAITPPDGSGPGSSGGTVDTTTPVAPFGSVAFREITLGIKHDSDTSQPLTVTVDLI